MPIRIRTKTNKVVRLDDSAKFVEIITDDGKVAAVTYLEDNGTVVRMDADAPELQQYCKMFKATLAKPLGEVRSCQT